MELREIQNKEEWESFLLSCSQKTFLQSWSWGEFNKAMSSDSRGKIWRFGIYNNERLIAVALVIKISARRGTFLFIPHGPVIVEGLEIKDKKEILKILLFELNSIAKEEKASFIRIAPIWPACPDFNFKDLGFRPSPIHMHAEVTWELDISPEENVLLQDMRKTTRYLIRQAEKNPALEIVKSNNIDDLKLFWPIYAETAKRHHFVVFSKKYLETEFKVFSENKEILLFLGKYSPPHQTGMQQNEVSKAKKSPLWCGGKGEVVSAAIFVFWQNMCFYHHSGSILKYNKIPVSYLLQWEAIKEAKNRGCRTYNFWGIAPDIKEEGPKGSPFKKSKHPWAGLSLFKMGFGGCRKEYIKTQDFIISPKYWLNYIIETIRKRKRNL